MNDGVDFGHSLAASDLLIEVEAGGHIRVILQLNGNFFVGI
jgi:hypothetical protein